MKTVWPLLLALLATPAAAAGGPPADPAAPAKTLFGAVTQPAALQPRPIGTYGRGCLSGAEALPVDGPAWQVMRLERNRNWGHPALVAFLERLSAAAPKLGWNGLLVGDMSQPRGGPMASGHASHQIGLDADIWLTPMPDHRLSREERRDLSAVSMLKGDSLYVDPSLWSDSRARLIRQAAKDPAVTRIFVHPGIKKTLCDWAGADRAWLSKVRPWWGHNYHFHVRLACPAGESACKDQDKPATGDGCGKELAWWFTDEPWKPAPKSDKPVKPPKPVTLADLPPACTRVLTAPPN
ncbi:penicillin-insensitive murein endopeptidase [Segnochrobactraceae bacterium EtOH-i3]